MGAAAVAARDVQILHRPAAGGQGPRRRRAVPEPARQGVVVCSRNRRSALDRLRLVCRKRPPTTTSGTAPPRCSQPWRSPPARCTGACYPRHRHQEFLKFLKKVARAYPRVELHIVADNYAAHKHPDVQAWLAKHPRITLHFTPTSGSWLNMVEIFFGIITRQAIRRGTFTSRQGPHHRDRHLHRRLERPLPALRLDQDSRRVTFALPPRHEDVVHEALGPIMTFPHRRRAAQWQI